MSTIPVFNGIRIIPRDGDFLNRKFGSRGEIFYDKDADTLRLYNGTATNGIPLSRADLDNVSTTTFRGKSVESRLATVVYTVTITGPQGVDSGNKYNLNGVYRAIPNFVVGYTYVFVQDDQTNVFFPNANGTTPNPHPLNFSADNLSGERGGGTSYLTDVRYFLDGASVTQAVYNSTAFNTATSRQVWITVTNSTPSTLYYWCWNHTAMGNSIAVADPGSGTGSGGVSVSVASTVPESPNQGSLWLDTNTGSLYVYYEDADSQQWIQPAFPFPDITGLATVASLSPVATSGDYNDLINSPTNISEFNNDAGYLTGIPDAINSTILADDSSLLIDASSGQINTYALSQVSATDGQALVWNTSNSRWQPSGDFVSPSGTQTLTNKRINPRSVNASATAGTITPNSDITDVYVAEGLTGAITVDTPSGTPVNGQKLLIRLKDNGTGRSITWTTTSGAFRAVGITLPTTTVASKTSYVGCVYNSADSFWDAIAVVTQT